MDKNEALEFIGLKEPLTEETILSRYKERFNYYHMLYANAPNKVIEKIQQQNLEKLNQVKRTLLEDVAAKKDAFSKRFVEATPVEEALRGAVEVVEKEPVAWMIVHTEGQQAESFAVFEGVNYIGRKKKDEANSIVLANDPYVSRTHAFVKAKRVNGAWQFALYDGDGSKPSVNGIYLNGRETRVNQQCVLEENDTVQIGMTKLVFKERKADKSLSGEVDEVLQTGFIRTVDIKT